MKNTWNSLNIKKEWKKKLLVEWKIGTFGVYNLTTTTTTTTISSAAAVRGKPQAKNWGSQNWVRANARSSPDIMICLALQLSCTCIQKLWSSQSTVCACIQREREKRKAVITLQFLQFRTRWAAFEVSRGQSSLNSRIFLNCVYVCVCVLPPTDSSLSEFINERAHIFSLKMNCWHVSRKEEEKAHWD